MTNGEKFKEIFSITQVDDCDLNVYAWLPIHDAIEIPLEWWNAEYKEPTYTSQIAQKAYEDGKKDGYVQAKLEQEPATKNEAKYCDRNICLKNEYNNVGCEDCEVTKSQEPTTRNCFGCKYSNDNHNAGTEECHLCMWENQYTPTTKNDLGVSSELEKNSKKLEKDFGELDCISRKQALKALKESAEHHANDSREEVLLRRDRDIIRSLPSVTPQEPKTGYWIHGEYCSECGCDVPAYIIDWKWQKDMNAKYCPNCGAYMRGKEE